MSNELFEMWKKRGINPQGGPVPKIDQKKTSTNPPPSYVPTLSAKPAPPAEKRKTANDEMREIMEKKEIAQDKPAPSKPEVKRTYLNEAPKPIETVHKVPVPDKKETANDEMKKIMETKPVPSYKPKEVTKKKTANEEMQEIMQAKGSQGFQPREVTKKKTANEEMQEIMKMKEAQEIQSRGVTKKKTANDEMQEIMKQKSEVPEKPAEVINKRTEIPQSEPIKPAPPKLKEPVKKRTANDEMREIMERKGMQQMNIKESTKRKTANEEMEEIMRSKGEHQAPPPVKEKKQTYMEEMKRTIPSGGAINKGSASKSAGPPPTWEIKKIEDDSQMNQLKAMLEAQIRFNQGDTLEMKPKSEEEPIPEPQREPENQEYEQPADRKSVV